MAPEVAEVEQALLALAPEERAAVIHTGLLSLDGGSAKASQDDIDDAWRGEIGNRLDDILQGRVELGSFEATRAKFAAKYPTSTRRLTNIRSTPTRVPSCSMPPSYTSRQNPGSATRSLTKWPRQSRRSRRTRRVGRRSPAGIGSRSSVLKARNGSITESSTSCTMASR